MTVPEPLTGSACVAGSRRNETEKVRALSWSRTAVSTRFGLSTKEPRETAHQRAEFLRSELALCFTFLFVADVHYEVGKADSAERSLANAEEVYFGVLPFVSEPGFSKHLTTEAVEGFTTALGQLRERLNGLKRLGK